jgi:hypothetical protein
MNRRGVGFEKGQLKILKARSLVLDVQRIMANAQGLFP